MIGHKLVIIYGICPKVRFFLLNPHFLAPELVIFILNMARHIISKVRIGKTYPLLAALHVRGQTL